MQRRLIICVVDLSKKSSASPFRHGRSVTATNNSQNASQLSSGAVVLRKSLQTSTPFCRLLERNITFLCLPILDYPRNIVALLTFCTCWKAENRILHLPQPCLERAHDLRHQSLDDYSLPTSTLYGTIPSTTSTILCNFLSIVHTSASVASYSNSSRTIASCRKEFE